MDSSGGLVEGATLTVTSVATNDKRTAASGADGTFRVALLPPGTYVVNVQKAGFKTVTQSSVQIVITEITKLNIALQVGTIQETVEVTANSELAQTESSALGRVVDEQVVTNLPLVTRNYTQILSLSPGVIAPVNNATELGRGNGGLSGIVGTFGNDASVHTNGMRSIDNNFQMNGVQINDLSGSPGSSGCGKDPPTSRTITGSRLVSR